MSDQPSRKLGKSSGNGWQLFDPSSLIEESPYTFFVPSEAEKSALKAGDLVKLIFESLDPEGGYTERMWVICEEQDERGWHGQLNNKPYDIEGLSLGDRIRFENHHIVSVYEPKFDNVIDEDRFFLRCHVDERIIDGDATISRLERRKPKWFWWWQREHQLYADSGWHIFADKASNIKSAKMSYVAIGLVLNKDDSILRFLDEPIRTRLTRNGDSFEHG